MLSDAEEDVGADIMLVVVVLVLQPLLYVSSSVVLAIACQQKQE